MKRPQSAKPGYKGYWGQASSEEFQDNNTNVVKTRKPVRLLKPDMTTNDFARVLPKKIYQDKERLYSQVLQLKQNLNEATQENTRLKTKISVIEKQRNKINKYLDQTPETTSGNKNSRLQNVMGTQSACKETTTVRTLKQIVRDCREENEMVKQQNTRIKKAVKYTKLNELQIERKMLLDENKRLGMLLQELNERLDSQDDLQNEVSDLKRVLEEEMHENKQLSDTNQQLEEAVEQLKDELKNISEKSSAKEKKLQRELAIEKRRCQESIKQADELRKEIKSVQEGYATEQRKKVMVKSFPRSGVAQAKPTSQVKSNMSQSNTGDQDLLTKYQQIEKQLRETQQRLHQSEEQRSKLLSATHSNRINIESNPIDIDSSSAQPPKDSKRQLTNQSNKIIPEQTQTHKEPKAEEDGEDYAEDFGAASEKLEESEEEAIYKKEKTKEEPPLLNDSPKQKKHEEPKKVKGDKSLKKTVKQFKPDKKKLAQIKELLTYRMKVQRYPFQDLEKDIQAADTTNFGYADLCNLLCHQPFFLNETYIVAFLSYCFEKSNPGENEAIDAKTLIKKLRKVIEDFVLIEEDEEREMIERICDMTTNYPNQLKLAFENLKNTDTTISKKDLIEMFVKLELDKPFIQLIIAELSIFSEDLEHLNFESFFERFFVEAEEYNEGSTISEKQSEESEHTHREDARKKMKVEGAKRSQFDEEDIVSDDGRI